MLPIGSEYAKNRQLPPGLTIVKKKMRFLRTTAFLTLSLTLTASATAATNLQLYVQDPYSRWNQRVTIDQGRLSIDNPGGDPNHTLLYEQSSNQFTLIDHKRRAYLILDRLLLAQMASAIMALGLASTEVEPEKAKYVDTHEQRTIKGWRCSVIKKLRSRYPESELCLAQPNILPLPSGDYATLRAMLAEAGQLVKDARQLPHDFFRSLPDLEGLKLEGVPIWFSQPERKTVVTLTQIQDSPSAARNAAIPPGYRQAQITDLLSSEWAPM